MTTARQTISSVDEWYEKWSLSKDRPKLRSEEAQQAIGELEALVESYCDLQLKK